MRKKSIHVILFVFAFILVSRNVYAEESFSGNVYSDSIVVEAASEISVPIYLRNNPGLKGYMLHFSYDPDFMKPISVDAGDLCSSGNFDDDIEGSTSTKDSFKVVWNGASVVSGNGLMLTLHFMLNEAATGITTLKVICDESNTYNEDYKNTALDCSSIVIGTVKYGVPDLVLPNNLNIIEESAFEGTNVNIVYLPETCTVIEENAFRNSKIKQVKIPVNCIIEENAFEGCESVLIFSKKASKAEAYCNNHSNCIFVEVKND